MIRNFKMKKYSFISKSGTHMHYSQMQVQYLFLIAVSRIAIDESHTRLTRDLPTLKIAA